MSEFPQTGRNQVTRLPERAAYDPQTIYSILDAAMICHVAFIQDGQPFIIPTLYARLGNSLLLHGSRSSRLLQHIQAGQPVSIAVTLLDGLILARSVFEHSVRYRSVVLFGHGHSIDDPAQKLDALRILTEHIVPGRWDDARQPNKKELGATSIVAIDIESASAKSNQGMPQDFPADYTLPVWAGVLPLVQHFQEPQRDPRLDAAIPLPDYLIRLLTDNA